jgi:hypothetical protein
VLIAFPPALSQSLIYEAVRLEVQIAFLNLLTILKLLIRLWAIKVFPPPRQPSDTVVDNWLFRMSNNSTKAIDNLKKRNKPREDWL